MSLQWGAVLTSLWVLLAIDEGSVIYPTHSPIQWTVGKTRKRHF